MKRVKRSTISGRDPISQLYRAIVRYVASEGGSVLVVGGVQTQEWDLPNSAKFTIGVKCVGKLPLFARTVPSGESCARSPEMNWTQEELDERNRRVLGNAPSNIAPVQGLVVAPGCTDVPEAEIQAEITKLLEEDGWRALRTEPVSDRGRGRGFGELGMADALMIRYDFSRQAAAVDNLADIGFDGLVEGETRHTLRAYADVMWIEHKRPGEKAKKHQQLWHQNERAMGALTIIAGEDFPASVEGFLGWYKASGLQRRK